MPEGVSIHLCVIKQKKMTPLKSTLFASLIGFFISQNVNAQTHDWKHDRKIAVLTGLSQALVVRGFNIEANYIHNRLIFDYSHGASLDFDKNLVTDELKAQGVVVHMPFSTGIGVGYRFTEWLNLRVEPKWHRFEFYYDGEDQNSANRIATDKNNFSVGLGLYTFLQPFKKKENLLKGLTIAPSIRFWPMVSSSFTNNKFTYQNKNTGKQEELKTLASGVGFTPLIINISIGYTFNLKKKN